MAARTLCLAAALAVAAALALPARAHDSDKPFAEWMMSLKQPDHPMISCCGPADQFYVDQYEPSAVDPGGFRAMVNGQWIEVPARKVVWDRVNPTGRGVIFVSVVERPGDVAAFVYCFVPGSGA